MYFIFSDVHGCLDEMNELLKYWDRDNETLIFLGDMIDRGYNSFGVIKRLMELKRKYNDKVFVLRGNHEDEFIKWLNLEPELKPLLYTDSLHNTVKSFYQHDLKQFQKDTRKQRADYIKRNYPEIIRFLNELPYFHETYSCIFVHAGINFNIPNWREDKDSMLWIREEYLFSSEYSIKRIFSGHTPTRFLNDDKSDTIWLSDHGDKVGIDGGLVFGGQLNGLKVDKNGQIKEILTITSEDIAAVKKNN